MLFSPLKDAESVTSMISAISLFGGLSESQLNELLAQLDQGTIKKGECIFRQGDEPTHIYIIKSGKVEIQISNSEAVLNKQELVAGECFGEVSIMAIHQHTASAVVIEDCEIVALSRHALIQVKKHDITLFALLMMNIARELARRLILTDNLCLLLKSHGCNL